MTTNLPLSQQIDAHELESKGLRDLFRIQLRDSGSTVLYITAHNQLNYMGKTWEQWPCNLGESEHNSSGEVSRPKFSISNPNGVFSIWVREGAVDGAIVTRYRCLLTDIADGIHAYEKTLRVCGKVVSLNKSLVVTELRATTDGPNFKLPARAFYPPDFPHVSLR